MIQLNILEMTELQKWRTDEWFPGVKEEIHMQLIRNNTEKFHCYKYPIHENKKTSESK